MWWYFRAIYLFLSETFWFFTIDKAVELSVAMVMGYIWVSSSRTVSLRSSQTILCSHVTSLQQYDSAIYSGSPDDSATRVPPFFVDITGASFNFINNPVVDFLVSQQPAQSPSNYASILAVLLAGQNKQRTFVAFEYLSTLLASPKCLLGGSWTCLFGIEAANVFVFLDQTAKYIKIPTRFRERPCTPD